MVIDGLAMRIRGSIATRSRGNSAG